MYGRRPQRGLETQNVIFQTKLKRALKGPSKTSVFKRNLKGAQIKGPRKKVIFQTKFKRAIKGPRKTKSGFSNEILKGPKGA